MSAIKLSTPSSGSISLSPADTASNLTITVPAVTGTMLTTASAGTVLQVVNATYATEVQILTTTLTDTGLTASITPTSATSKILVIVSLAGSLNVSTNSAIELKARLLRGSTTILDMGSTNGLGFRIGAGTDSAGRITMANTMSLSYLDSPSTTSSTTYKMQAAPSTTSNSGRATINWGSDVNSTITLMEIAA
jgi:hypothetical protein